MVIFLSFALFLGPCFAYRLKEQALGVLLALHDISPRLWTGVCAAGLQAGARRQVVICIQYKFALPRGLIDVTKLSTEIITWGVPRH